MDMLTFTAEIFKAAAWPAVAVAVVLVFRPQLRALMARLSRGRLGPAEFEFEQQLKALAARAPRAGRAAPGAATAFASAAVMPAAGAARDAVLAAWARLEQAARTGMQQLSGRDMALYRQLGALRDQAQHSPGFEPSAESARTYVQLAQGLQERMQRGRSAADGS